MQILKDKNAIIYGAYGSLGSTIAKALADAGAHVFLTGRSLSSLQKIADEVTSAGGAAEIAEVDAMDETAIDNHLQKVIANCGKVDIVYNAVDYKVIQGMPLTDMKVDDFTRPVNIAMHSLFLTSTSAARVMMKQKSGVILTLSATPAGISYPYTAGFAIACSAIETFSQNLASEIGPYGIRVVNIRSGGSPDSFVFKDAIERDPETMKTVLQSMEADTMLKKLPLMAEIANVAVFLTSDLASKITGVTVDVTAGTTAGLNYRVQTVPTGP